MIRFTIVTLSLVLPCRRCAQQVSMDTPGNLLNQKEARRIKMWGVSASAEEMVSR